LVEINQNKKLKGKKTKIKYIFQNIFLYKHIYMVKINQNKKLKGRQTKIKYIFQFYEKNFPSTSELVYN